LEKGPLVKERLFLRPKKGVLLVARKKRNGVK